MLHYPYLNIHSCLLTEFCLDLVLDTDKADGTSTVVSGDQNKTNASGSGAGLKKAFVRPIVTSTSDVTNVRTCLSQREGGRETTGNATTTRTNVPQGGDATKGEVPDEGEKECLCFSVFYTKKSHKKRKTYVDGILVIALSTGRSDLYDTSDGKKLASIRLRVDDELRRMNSGSQLDFGTYELEITTKLDYETQFRTGKVFLKSNENTSTNPSLSMTRSTHLVAGSSFQPPLNRPANASSSFQPPLGRPVTTDMPSASRPPVPVSSSKSNSASGADGKLRNLTNLKLSKSFALNRDDSNGKAPHVLCTIPPNGHHHPGGEMILDGFLSRIMRPHQTEGLEFLLKCISGNRHPKYLGCVLADEMGLGKTLQSIALVWTVLKHPRHPKPLCKKCVIVCPASLVGNWTKEFNKFLGPARLKPISIMKSDEALEQIDEFLLGLTRPVLILSYETYRKYSERLNGRSHSRSSTGPGAGGGTPTFDLLICDEGHRLKSSGGNKTIEALSAAPTKRRVILTGTPLQNQLNEFYSLVSFVNYGVLGQDAKQFKRIFETPIGLGRDACATREASLLAEARSQELFQLTSEFILRRTSELVSKHLPPKHVYDVFIRLSQDQMDSYVTSLEHLLHDPQGVGGTSSQQHQQHVSGSHALQLISQLKNICTFPPSLFILVHHSVRHSTFPCSSPSIISILFLRHLFLDHYSGTISLHHALSIILFVTHCPHSSPRIVILTDHFTFRSGILLITPHPSLGVVVSVVHSSALTLLAHPSAVETFFSGYRYSSHSM